MNTQKVVFEHQQVPGRVSIVIPARNSDPYIGATLVSIGQQTYKDWEVIVIEDGSTGRTHQIVADFAKKFPGKVFYYRNERNCGAGQTRNLAFARSTGEFIALLDSDDRWLPNHLEATTSVLLTTKKDIVYSTVQMVEDGTDRVLGVWGPIEQELDSFPQSLFGRSFVTPSATVMRRSVIADVGAWSARHRYCEDFDFWLRCIEKAKTFQHIEGVHCLYRKNHNGATTQKMSGLLEEVAVTTKDHMLMPGMDRKACRNHAVNAFLLAAKFHHKANLPNDTSADPSRAGILTLQAWMLNPARIRLLWRGLRLSFSGQFARVKTTAPVRTKNITQYEIKSAA